jgi:predicted permease
VYAAVEEGLRRLPGVQSVGLAATVPFGMMDLGKDVSPSEAGPSDRRRTIDARVNIVSEDYFQAIGIPLLRGRPFSSSEMSPETKSHVAIVDRLAANKLWPNGDAIGKHIRLGSKADQDLEVVGVAGGIRNGIIGRGLDPHVYVPFGQQYQSDMQVHIKTVAGGPEAQARMLEAVRQEIRAVDPRLPLLTLKTMRGHLESGIDFWVVRTGAQMLEIFGVAALLLAVIGLYAVNAYSVARRTREIGIRMALGADAAATLRTVLGEGLRVTAVGLGVGLLLALGIGQVLAGFLYGIPRFDAAVLTGAPFVLALVSLLACYIPARRAARVDPLTALHYQ